MIALQQKEIELQKENFNQMKEITDRAIKLAETTKPKSNNLLYIIGGIFVWIITGLAIAL